MNPPNIPPHVLKEMWDFFLKTSVPGLLEEKIKRESEQKCLSK